MTEIPVRSGAAAVSLAVLLLQAPAAPAQVELEAGGFGSGSLWTIDTTGGTSNGAPAGGSCDGSPAMTVVDAVLDPDDISQIGTQGDAYDNGQVVFIDGVPFAPAEFDVSERSVLGGPELLSGLEVRVEYGAALATATVRTLIGLTNPSGDEIEVTVDHVTNVGSDGSTVVHRTSSGDTNFNVLDRWVITRESSMPTSDPVITHVHRGLAQAGGSVQVASAVSQTVFDCAGTQGIRVTYDVAVPAGETRYLLFFNQLNPTAAEAATVAPELFGNNPSVGGDLLFGLLPEQLLDVVNWDFRVECRSARKLKLKLEADDGKLRYKWAKGDATLASEFADPTHTTPYGLCIVDFAGGVPEIERCYDLLPGLDWKEKGNGFKFDDDGGVQHGLTDLRLRRGEQDKTKIKARGEQMALPELPLAQDPAVAVIVANDRGLCWVGRFDEPAKVNTAEEFVAKQRRDPEPEPPDEEP